MKDGSGNGNGNGRTLPELDELRVRTLAAKRDVALATALATSPRDRSSEVARACKTAHFELERIVETAEAIGSRARALHAEARALEGAGERDRLLAAVDSIVEDVASRLRLGDDAGIRDPEEARKHDAALDSFESVLRDELRRFRAGVYVSEVAGVRAVDPGPEFRPPGGGDLLELLDAARTALRPGQASTAIAALVSRIDAALGAYQYPGAC
jgi:hypothetical protein